MCNSKSYTRDVIDIQFPLWKNALKINNNNFQKNNFHSISPIVQWYYLVGFPLRRFLKAFRCALLCPDRWNGVEAVLSYSRVIHWQIQSFFHYKQNIIVSVGLIASDAKWVEEEEEECGEPY